MASNKIPEGMVRLSMSRCAFVMKAIAENDLWDEMQAHLLNLV
jgi:hypothetical protein